MPSASPSRFQKPAAAPVAMRLWAWGARVLYVGEALGLSPHRNAVAVLAVGVDAPFGVAASPTKPSRGYRTCRTAVIPPNTLHHLAHTVGTMAFLYVDACSHELGRLRSLAAVRSPRADFDLSVERELVDVLAGLADRTRPWPSVRATLDSLLVGTPPPIDPRVQRALRRLHADPSVRLPLAELAHEAALSDSRFLHLFKSATGVPFRRYKLWIAMGAAMRAVTRGADLTTAAHDAGFSSSAHFSAAFREMFGIEPSRLARGRLVAMAASDA